MTLDEGQEMTMTFNTHIPSLTQLVVCIYKLILLAGVSGGFPGVLPFRPRIDWLVSMSEIILKGTLN